MHADTAGGSVEAGCKAAVWTPGAAIATAKTDADEDADARHIAAEVAVAAIQCTSHSHPVAPSLKTSPLTI